MVNHCEVIGQPQNEVTVFWDARRSSRSGSMRIRISDQRVSTRQVMSTIISTLTLDEDSEFSEPKCTARLGNDSDLTDPIVNFEETQSKLATEFINVILRELFLYYMCTHNIFPCSK